MRRLARFRRSYVAIDLCSGTYLKVVYLPFLFLDVLRGLLLLRALLRLSRERPLEEREMLDSLLEPPPVAIVEVEDTLDDLEAAATGNAALGAGGGGGGGGISEALTAGIAVKAEVNDSRKELSIWDILATNLDSRAEISEAITEAGGSGGLTGAVLAGTALTEHGG